MADYSLVPVQHQPDFENVSLVPVDQDPFSADDVTQRAAAQQAQSRLEQPPWQQPATGVGRIYVGPNNTQASAAGESWNPETGNSDTSRLDRSAASTPAQDNPALDWSRFNQPFGELKSATFTPTQQIGHRAIDALTALGVPLHNAQELTTRIGNLLGLTPLGVAGSFLNLIDAKRRDDLPGAVEAAAGLIPGAKGVGRVAGKEVRALTSKVRLSPAAWAAKKGYAGVGTTANGGPTGSYRKDFALANKEGKFAETPDGYMWHHVDDFNPQTGTATFELINKDAHNATRPHAGSVAQYVKHHGVRYKR